MSVFNFLSYASDVFEKSNVIKLTIGEATDFFPPWRLLMNDAN